MGYCIELTNHDFKIRKENINKVLNALKNYMKTQNRLMWVSPRDVIQSDNILEAFSEIRYELEVDSNGDFTIDYFTGEKLGDDKDIFNSIALYIEPNSFIEFKGEDGDIFRLEFDGKTCKEVWE